MANGKVVVIGANDFQNPLILKAKELGYETHVFAWQDGSIGEKTADYFYPISIIEIDQILAKCREIKPDAVCSIGSDLAAITVTRIANALGLPANPPETAIIATNKYEMRKTFIQAGVPAPRFCSVAVGSSLDEIDQMRFPIIVKPTDRSGSRGITKLMSRDGLDEAIAASVSHSFEKRAIVEEYIEGPEFSCECISQNGIHHMLAVTKKYTTGAPHFIETGHLEPSGLDESTLTRVQEAVFDALDALHIRCGASHSEFKIVPETGEIMIIEIGARMGGDCIGSDLVMLSTGQDFVRMTLETALGLPISLKSVQKPCVAAIRFVFNENDYRHFCRIKEQYPEKIFRNSAFEIREESSVTDSSSRFGFYILNCDNLEEAVKLADLQEQ